MSYRQRDYRLIIIATGLGQFGAAVTWTGLPVFVAELTGRISDLSALFIASSLTSLLFTMAGGMLADRLSRRQLAIGGSLASAIVMSGLAFALDPDRPEIFYIAGVLNTLITALTLPALTTWFNAIASDVRGDLVRGIGTKSFVVMGSKMVGFASGPLLYAALGKPALLVTVGMSLLEAAALVFVVHLGQPETTRRRLESGADIVQHLNIKHVHLLGLAAIVGLASYPMVNAGVSTMKSTFAAPSHFLSLYWIGGAGGALVGNFLLSRGALQPGREQSYFVYMAAIAIAAVLTLGLATGPIVFVAAHTLHSFTAISMRNMLGAEAFRSVATEYQGRFTAFCTIFEEAAGLAGLAALLLLQERFGAQALYLLLLPFFAARLVLGIAMWSRKRMPATGEKIVTY